MSKQFKFLLSSPDTVLYDGEVESVTFHGADGEITIMADHTPIVMVVSPGVMTINAKDKTETLAVGSGFAKVTKGNLKIFAQTAEFADSIDEQRALEAKKLAEEHLKDQKGQISLADATSLLERNIARIKAVERKKKRVHH